MSESADILRRITHLEKQAEVILNAKRKTLARRPIVIEFSGTPKSGKSSCISSLDIFLRRNNFRTKVLTERASVCPIENKFDPLFNVWNACASLNQLSEIVSSRPREFDVIIMDRGFFDALCWFQWQKRSGFLGEDDFQRFTSFFTAERFRMMIDLVIHFDALPETSMNREYKNLLTRKEGSVMRDYVLEGYRIAAADARRVYGSLFRQFEEFKTDTHGQNEVSAMVTELVLSKLRDVAKERVAYIPKTTLENAFGKKEITQFSNIRSVLNASIEFEDREILDGNDRNPHDITKVQIIPVAMLKDNKKFQFVVARKGKQATSNKSPEMNKILLYFGGHVREEDKTLFDSSDILGVLYQCLFRELKEELGIDVRQLSDDPVCIWVRDGSKSEIHMAIGFVVERDLEYTKLSIDEREFVRLTKKEKYGTGSIIDGIAINAEITKLDSWSKALLESFFSDDFSWQAQGELLK